MENFVLNSRKIKLLSFFFLIILSFIFLVSVYSYSTNNTHPVLTEEAIKFFNNKSSDYEISQNEAEWLKQGSVEEDEPPRYINHFYDPVHNIGWTGKHFGSLSEEEGYKTGSDMAPKPAVSSKNWSQNQEYQAAYGRQYGNQTWQKAINLFIKGDKKSAFVALGHVLHLIEDMSVPDHTRNDSHPGLYSDPGSPYESYTKTYTNFNKLNVNDDLINQNKEFISLNTLDNAFDYLANYSNRNFFSEDTINNDDFKEPNLLILRKDVKVIDQEKILFLRSNALDSYLSFFNNKTNRYSTNDKDFILSSYRTHLFPQSVLVSASVIDLFFKEAERYEENPELLESIMSDSQESIAQIIKHSPKIIALKTSDLIDEGLTSAKVFIVKGIENIKQSLVEIKSTFTSNTQTAGPGFLLTSDNNQNEDVEHSVSNTNNIAAESEPEPIYDVGSEQTSQTSTVSQIQHMRDLTNEISSTSDVEEKLEPTIKPLVSSGIETEPAPGVGNLTPGIIEPKFSFAGAPYAGFGGGGAPPQPPQTTTVVDSTEPEAPPPANPELEEPPIPEPEIPIDATPPDVSLNILECQNSFSSDGCLVATSTLNISWQSLAEDFDYYELSQGGMISTTTATSTTTSVLDNSTNNFSVRAVDKNGNWSAPQTTTVVVSSMPVVINEVAWAGTSADNYSDEWIELYNRTNYPVNLQNWTLYSKTDMGPYINLSGTIPAWGYYLMERTDDDTISDIPADWKGSFSNGLNNLGENLILSCASTTMDEVPYFYRWRGGSDYSYLSMERIDPNVTGTDMNNWGSNIYEGLVRNGRDVDGKKINGTPKARNSLTYLIAKGSSPITSDVILTKAGSPYIVNNSNQYFQGNATVTIEPGVVIKFYSNAGLNFSGNSKIIAQGTAEEPIVFTSYVDDAYGGDLDATSTTPYAGGWLSVRVETANNDSVFDHTLFRYGGKYYSMGDYSRANFSIQNSSAIISNSIFEHSLAYGLKLTNSNSNVSNNIFRNNNYVGDTAGINSAIYVLGGSPQIRNNTISQNGRGIYLNGSSAIIDSNIINSNVGEAIYSSGMTGIISNNSGSGNGTDGIIFSLSGSLNSSATLKTNPLPYILNSVISVASSTTLTIESGVTIKCGGGYWGGRLDVSGNLLVNGISAGDVIFTSSSASPNPGDWQGIRLYSGSYSNIKGATFGYAEKALVYENSPVNLENVKFENNKVAVQADAGSLFDGTITSTIEFLNNTTNTIPAGLLGL